jgi:hypothetical protein
MPIGPDHAGALAGAGCLDLWGFFMAKVAGPLYSERATGSIGRVLTFRHDGVNTTINKMPKSRVMTAPAVLRQQKHFKALVKQWNALTKRQRGLWAYHSPKNMGGWAYFLSVNGSTRLQRGFDAPLKNLFTSMRAGEGVSVSDSVLMLSGGYLEAWALFGPYPLDDLVDIFNTQASFLFASAAGVSCRVFIAIVPHGLSFPDVSDFMEAFDGQPLPGISLGQSGVGLSMWVRITVSPS